MLKRRRFKQTSSLADRLQLDTERLHGEIRDLPNGASPEDCLRRIRQNEIALHLNEWLESPGLRAPK